MPFSCGGGSLFAVNEDQSFRFLLVLQVHQVLFLDLEEQCPELFRGCSFLFRVDGWISGRPREELLSCEERGIYL